MKHGQGLGARITAFFRDNPDEELTYPIIAAKFGCSVPSARFAVKQLVKERTIESLHVVRLRVKGIAK
jgi:hypothetical protein